MAIGISDIVIKTSISKTGDFSLSPEVLQTWATAMDIQVIFSFFRIFLFFVGYSGNTQHPTPSHPPCRLIHDIL